MRSWLFNLCLILTACSQERVSDEMKLFRLLTPDKTGIHFTNSLDEEKLNILEYMYYYNGGGVAVGDINNDGFADIYFTANEKSNSLFLNNGDFSFTDITEKSKTSGVGDWATGVTMVDINNDGFLDIYVSRVSGWKNLRGHNELFINNGDLTFTERAAEYGLDFRGFSTQACFFDYDNDGDLDLYLLNHSVHSVRSYGKALLREETDTLAGDRLYRNDSERGRVKFTDITKEAGIFSSQIGYGLGVSVADINRDGWKDLYVGNDFHENDYLYINNRDGTYTEVLENWAGHTTRYSMGNDIGDINLDGLPDVVTVDMLPYKSEILLKSVWEDLQDVYDIKQEFGYSHQYVRNCLLLNRKDHFIDLAQYAGIHATDWSWSPLICDLDNDAFPDLFITNGIYKRPNDLDYIQFTSDMAGKGEETVRNRRLIESLPTLKIPNFVYQNKGAITFMDVTESWGLHEPSYSNGAAYCDLDNDGDLDLIINNVNQPAFVYENRTELLTKNNYLDIHLRSDKTNIFGVGARVVVHAGNIRSEKEVSLVHGFQSSAEPRIHFGLGSQDKVDSVEIFWNHQLRKVLHRVEPNTPLFISDSGSHMVHQNSALAENPVSVQIPFTHVENKFSEFSGEPLIPVSFAAEGPALAVIDVNNDDMHDIYIGGAHGQPGELLLQQQDKTWKSENRSAFFSDREYEDVDAVFVDVNGDNLFDLYVVSGGNQYPAGDNLYQDRLYMNQGKGVFTRADDALPFLAVNGSCVRPYDFDNDGDMDLFLGTRSIPGQYGKSPESYLLENSGSGKFTVHTKLSAGPVTDARWSDLNGDGRAELVIAAEWRPVVIYSFTEGKFTKVAATGFEQSNGWWRSIAVGDVNKDGLPDLVVGNCGTNNRLQVSPEKPITMYLGDFDSNGKNDPLIFHYVGGNNVPLMQKIPLGKQLPLLNRKFTSFSEFSKVRTPEDLIAPEALKKAEKMLVETLQTTLFLNDGKFSFSRSALPPEAQYSAVEDIAIGDLDDDGIADLLFAGNFFQNHVILGRFDAQSVLMLKGDGKGGFTAVNKTNKTNFDAAFRRIERIIIADQLFILLAKNNGRPEIVPLE